MLTVVCVLKKSSDFDVPQVVSLFELVKANLTVPHAFVCLTDTEINHPEISEISLKHDFPGYYCKIEVFRDLFIGRVLFLDLDTVICGNIDAYAHLSVPFAMLGGMTHRDQPASGVMTWEASLTPPVYEKFLRNPEEHIKQSNKGMEGYPNYRGDQKFIGEVVGFDVPKLQDIFPDTIYSYKKHVRQFGCPPTANIVAFHGKPRPWEINIKAEIYDRIY